MSKISYRKLRKYKYQIMEDYHLNISLKPDNEIVTSFILLNIKGDMIIKARYAWDGPSGPTIDTKNFMRGSSILGTSPLTS